MGKGANDGARFAACWVPGDQSWPVMGHLWRRKEESQDEAGWLGLYTEACVVVDPHILEFRQKAQDVRGRPRRTGSGPVNAACLLGWD